MNRWLYALLLTGCSTVQWDKPDATPATVNEDLRVCSASVQSISARAEDRTTGNEMRAGPGITAVPSPLYVNVDRQLLQGARIEQCMRARGYALRSTSSTTSQREAAAPARVTNNLPLPVGKQCMREMKETCVNDQAKTCTYARIDECS